MSVHCLDKGRDTRVGSGGVTLTPAQAQQIALARIVILDPDVVILDLQMPALDGFGVLKSAVTPRVVPPSIDLVRVNSRLTTFALLGGTMVGGAIAAAFEVVLGTFLPLHWPGAMLLLIVVACLGAYYCMKIPSWVEVTAGEIPTTLTYRNQPKPDISARERARRAGRVISDTIRQPLGRNVVTGLWGNGTIRILTGFLTLFVAFYARNQEGLDGWVQMAMLGAVVLARKQIEHGEEEKAAAARMAGMAGGGP